MELNFRIFLIGIACLILLISPFIFLIIFIVKYISALKGSNKRRTSAIVMLIIICIAVGFLIISVSILMQNGSGLASAGSFILVGLIFCSIIIFDIGSIIAIVVLSLLSNDNTREEDKSNNL